MKNNPKKDFNSYDGATIFQSFFYTAYKLSEDIKYDYNLTEKTYKIRNDNILLKRGDNLFAIYPKDIFYSIIFNFFHGCELAFKYVMSIKSIKFKEKHYSLKRYFYLLEASGCFKDGDLKNLINLIERYEKKFNVSLESIIDSKYPNNFINRNLNEVEISNVESFFENANFSFLENWDKSKLIFDSKEDFDSEEFRKDLLILNSYFRKIGKSGQ